MNRVIDGLNPTVSIVVPLYGVEAVMGECIESILSQSYENIDVILVDDGSPDKSGQKAEEYRDKDARIRVIHQENRGLSAARNVGTEAANGEYICFIDGDDVVDPECVAYLVGIIREHGAHMAVCPMRRFTDRQNRKNVHLGYSVCMGREEALREMLYQKKFDTSACAKLFRTKDALAIPFPEGKLYEDLDTVYRLIWHAGTVAYGPRALYFYRARTGSITRTQFSAKRFDELYAIERLCGFVSENCPALQRAVLCRRFSCFCQVFLALPQDDAMFAQAEKRIWDEICRLRRQTMLDPHVRIKNRCAALLALFGPRLFRLAWTICE